jgi:site-specific DNA recombinase
MEPGIDDTSNGRMLEGIVSTFAQWDNDQKSERTTAGMQAALNLGRWTFKAPLGYLNSRTKIGPSLVPDVERADLIRHAFEQVAAGISVADVLRQVNAAGLTGASGRALSLQSFRSLLKNQLLAGRIDAPKWGINRVSDFEPLVSETTFRRVQMRLSGKAEPVRHVKDREDFPLRRFLTCAKCQRSISGSWSKGRSGRYGYYHCPKCSGIRGRRDVVQAAFVAHLETLQPDSGYIRLFKAIVLDVWKAEQARARDVERLRAKRVSDLQGRLDRLDEAFIYEKSIQHDVYDRQRDKVQEELTIAELELHDARIDHKDVEGVLNFAEYLMTNAARVWVEASLPQRQQIQRAIFPEGLSFDGRGFGTAVTCLAFSTFAASKVDKSGMASPPGFERCGNTFYHRVLR